MLISVVFFKEGVCMLASLLDNSSIYIWGIFAMTIVLTLFFQFRKYTISFETNGGNEIKKKKQRTGSKIILPEAPTKDGFHFDGWYIDEELTKRLVLNQNPLRQNITLYAKWTITEEKTRK